jgi:glycolate oxidase iron-sulfur subunit
MPPDPALIADCVHCGFCLPACPTYSLWGEEMDSPRGRIHLMDQLVRGAPLDEVMVGHFDACLGCLACVPACPSGVRYDRLIAATRAQVERHHPRTRRDRALRAAVFTLFPHPARLRVLRGPLRAVQRTGLDRLVRRTGLLERVSPGLAAMERLTPRLGRPVRIPARVPARTTRRAVVGLLTGCVQRVFFGEVNAATARVLAAEGCDVIVPPEQGCCGALSWHGGRTDEARGHARRLTTTFRRHGVDVVVVNAAGCGSTVKEYAEVLGEPPGVQFRDVTEFLAELGPVAPRHPLPLTVAYHDACHLAHAQGVRGQPRALLRAIPDLDLREIADRDLCCGSAGVYNILHPQPARELADRKAAAVAATGVDLLVTANPGCLMQIGDALRRAGTPLASAHPVQVLDASIRGLSRDALGVGRLPAARAPQDPHGEVRA